MDEPKNYQDLYKEQKIINGIVARTNASLSNELEACRKRISGHQAALDEVNKFAEGRNRCVLTKLKEIEKLEAENHTLKTSAEASKKQLETALAEIDAWTKKYNELVTKHDALWTSTLKNTNDIREINRRMAESDKLHHEACMRQLDKAIEASSKLVQENTKLKADLKEQANEAELKDQVDDAEWTKIMEAPLHYTTGPCRECGTVVDMASTREGTAIICPKCFDALQGNGDCPKCFEFCRIGHCPKCDEAPQSPQDTEDHDNYCYVCYEKATAFIGKASYCAKCKPEHAYLYVPIETKCCGEKTSLVHYCIPCSYFMGEVDTWEIIDV